MQIRRHPGVATVTVVLGLAALAAGCGGSSTKATPLPNSAVPDSAARTATSAPTATAPSPGSVGGSGSSVAPTTAAPTPGTGSPVAGKPTPDQLAAVQHELDQAGTALTDGSAAVGGSDVNQAKTQEGSAP